MASKHVLAAALAVAAAGGAGAQALKPGLWQITHRTEGGGADTSQAMARMQKEMAGMSPEQRKMVEGMMARQGVQVGPAAAGGGMAMKICMTPEMVQRSEMPSQRGDCRTTSQARSGNTMTMAFACTNPPSQGEGRVTFTSPEAYTSKMTVTTMVQGKPQKVNMESSGQWLAADCGSVKPIAPPRR